jgi:hypothetical protein
VAPLLNWEHGVDTFDPGNDEDNCFAVPASFVVKADNDPGRDDGGPLGRRFCRLGSEVDGNYPKPTRHMPMHHDTTTVGRGTSGIEGLTGQTSNRARCAVSSIGLLWQQGIAEFAVQGINEWSVIDTSAGGRKQWHSWQLFCWLSILCTPVQLATDRWGMPLAPLAE